VNPAQTPALEHFISLGGKGLIAKEEGLHGQALSARIL